MSFLLDDDQPKHKSREECLAETPEELRVRMKEILRSSDLMPWIVRGIEAIGVAGEHLVALILYFTGTSRMLDRPLAAIVQGPSSSGKSFTIEKVASLFPPESVVLATDITANALYYIPSGSLEHRFVVAGERNRRQNDETAQATKALREMISSGQLTKLVTIADPEGPKTVTVHQRGPIAYVESTTAPEVFEEDANRCLILEPDERPEQTRRILRAAGRKLAGGASDVGLARLIAEFHCLQRLLEPAKVVIPFSDPLAERFPSEPLEVRRAFGHVAGMIQAVTLLHQFQRKMDVDGRVIAQPEDYWWARFILNEVLGRSLGGKSADGLKRFAKRLREFTGEQTAMELSQKMKMSDRTVRDNLNKLLGHGAIEQTEEGRGPIPAKWMVTSDIEIREPHTCRLPAVEDVCGVDEETLELPEMPANWACADLSDVPFVSCVLLAENLERCPPMGGEKSHGGEGNEAA